MSEPAGWEDVVLPIFPQPTPPPPKTKSRKDEADAANKIRYNKVGASGGHCDDCLESVAKGLSNYPYHAAYERKHGEHSRFLCFRHAQEWRDKDGLEALRP